MIRGREIFSGSRGRLKMDEKKQEKASKSEQEKGQEPKEIGGPKGLEPTRYGDWEINGRCSDF